MNVLIVEPGKPPREAQIEHTLEAMQAVVGGLIQALYPWEDHAALICDEEGLLKQYPFNRAISSRLMIYGTFFICGIDGEEFADLPPALMEKYKQKYQNPEVLIPGAKGPMLLVFIHDDEEEP